MNKFYFLKSIIILLLAAGSVAQADEHSITCKQSYRSLQSIIIKFSVEAADQIVQVLAITNSDTGMSHLMYDFVPSELKSSEAAFYAYSRKNTIGIDLSSGKGLIQYHAWEMVCSPGESEWCVAKFPNYIRMNFELESCQAN